MHISSNSTHASSPFFYHRRETRVESSAEATNWALKVRAGAVSMDMDKGRVEKMTLRGGG